MFLPHTLLYQNLSNKNRPHVIYRFYRFLFFLLYAGLRPVLFTLFKTTFYNSKYVLSNRCPSLSAFVTGPFTLSKNSSSRWFPLRVSITFFRFINWILLSRSGIASNFPRLLPVIKSFFKGCAQLPFLQWIRITQT